MNLNPQVFDVDCNENLNAAGYPRNTKITSLIPFHIKQSQRDRHCAVYALWSLAGGKMILKKDMDNVAIEMQTQLLIISEDIYDVYDDIEASTNGNYNIYVVQKVLGFLKLVHFELPASELLKRKADVDIVRCVDMPNLAGFLVCTGKHYLAYVVLPGHNNNGKLIYNCDSALEVPERIPTALHLRQELMIRRCKGETVFAIFRAS